MNRLSVGLLASSKILYLNLLYFHSLERIASPQPTHPHAIFELDKNLALAASFLVHFLRRKRCFSGGTDTSGGLETLRQLSGLLTDGGRRKKREIDFAIPKHIGIRARVEYGFQRIKH